MLRTELIVKLIMLFGFAAFVFLMGVLFLASITVFPMMENYAECASVFLCGSGG